MPAPLLEALAICAAAAVLEGVMAGSGVKARLAEVRGPPWSPPLWAWMAIGALYYVVCGAVLYRLLRLPTAPARTAALAILIALMTVNALWNAVFFRLRDLRLSFFTYIIYDVLALALLVLLFRVDVGAAWWFIPYCAYLVYGNAWGYTVWRMNPRAAADTGPNG